MSEKKILVVDDDRHVVRLVQANLERAGYKVIVAYDGFEAFEKIKTEHPDMVVTDDMMPRADCYELMKLIQADPQHQHIPIIILAEKKDDASIFKAWASGASGYYSKPFNSQEILVAVERIFQSLEEHPADSSPVDES